LVKIYRSRKSEVRALDGLDLTVAEGSVLGMLGPNGAGKTTAVRVLPAEHPIELTLIWVVVLVAIFAPLGVLKYRSMSR